MADGSGDGLGAKVVDSHELLKKNKSLLPIKVQSEPNPKDESGVHQPTDCDPTSKYVPPFARSTSSSPVELVPNLEVTHTLPNPNFSEIPTGFQNHSPKRSDRLSPARKLQQVFQQEANRVELEDRLASMVGYLEDEMGKAGSSGDVMLARLKDLKLQWGVQTPSMAALADPQSSTGTLIPDLPVHGSVGNSVSKVSKPQNPLGDTPLSDPPNPTTQIPIP